jgi:hypothetical protein
MLENQKSKLKVWLKFNPITIESYFTETDDTIKLNIEKIRQEFEENLSELIDLVNDVEKIK